MSEPKGTFDAIKITPLFGIDWVLSLLRACREINKDKPEHQKWIDEAYRVIEVVGKVDKGALLTLGANAVCIADYYCQGAELRDLEARFKRGEDDLKIIIASLPGKEKKCARSTAQRK